jgi:hypothetical protein
MFAKFNESLLVFKEQFYTADYDCFKLLVEFMISLDLEIMSPAESLDQLLPHYEKMFWLAKDPILSDHVDNKFRVLSSVIAHQAMHSLVAEKFGERLYKSAGLTLMSEAMATAVSVYFSFSTMKFQGKISGEEALDAYYPSTKKCPKFSKIRFIAEFNDFQQGSVTFTKDITFEIWNLYKQFFIIDGLRHAGQMEQLRPLKQYIEDMRFPWLGVRMDLSNNFLYTKANVSAKLKPSEVKEVEEFLHDVFDEAVSMADYVSRVGLAQLRS